MGCAVSFRKMDRRREKWKERTSADLALNSWRRLLSSWEMEVRNTSLPRLCFEFKSCWMLSSLLPHAYLDFFLPASLLSRTEEKGGSSSSSLYPVGICLACAQSQSELIAKEDVLLIPAWLSTHQWTDDTTHIYMCIPRDSCLLVSSDPKAKPVFVFASS